jgi:predicted nucleic acid-binding protein
MIVDTDALLAFFDRDEPDHRAVAAALENAAEPLVVSSTSSRSSTTWS